MKRAKFQRLEALAALLCAGLFHTGLAATPRVAVLDFELPIGTSNRWAWTSGGVADLFQIELERAGLDLLDRDFVRAVIAEQRLATSGRAAADSSRISALLHAQQLVAGQFEPVGEKRFKMEVSAFSVEAVETVARASGEGEFPKDFSRILRDTARELAARLVPRVAATGKDTPAYAPKPEALVLFYQGLDACTRGRPESAMAWFLAAERMDPEFGAPWLWEIRAYELMGFKTYAGTRREALSPMLRRMGFDSSIATEHALTNGIPVLAILPPIVGEGAIAQSSRLKELLEDAVLRSRTARLFSAKNMAAAVGELDLRLGSFFESRNAPRYGRWLMADGLLTCRVSEDHGRTVVDLAIADPMTAAVAVRSQRAGARDDLAALAADAVRELLTAWPRRTSGPGTTSAFQQPAIAADDPGTDTPADFRALGHGLMRVKREPASREAHLSLATTLRFWGNGGAAAQEFNTALQLFDASASDAEAQFFGLHRWLFADLPALDTNALMGVLQAITAKHPDSATTGCILYDLAREDWKRGNWPSCRERASHARKILERFPDRTLSPSSRHEVHAALLFMEGESLFQLGRDSEGKASFLEAWKLVREFNLRDFILPTSPLPDTRFGIRTIAGGGDRMVPTEIHRRLTALGVEIPRMQQRDAGRRAEEVVLAGNRQTRSATDWLACAREIAAILGSVSNGDAAARSQVVANAAGCLAEARAKGAAPEDLRSAAQQLARGVLDHAGLASLSTPTAASAATLAEIATELLLVHRSATPGNEAWAALSPFFREPHTIETGLTILLQSDMEPNRRRETLAGLRTRIPQDGAGVGTTSWIMIGQLLARDEQWRDALGSYQKAVAGGAKPDSCPGLARVLLELALDRNPSAAREENENLCQELSATPLKATWFEWFEAGRQYHTNAHFDLNRAVACYRSALASLDGPAPSGNFSLTFDAAGQLLHGPGKADRKDRPGDQHRISGTYYLAQCLVETGPREDAVALLRRLARDCGGDNYHILTEERRGSSRGTYARVGVWAAETLRKMHAAVDVASDPTAVAAVNPYKVLPTRGTRSRAIPLPPPAPDPATLSALTNALSAPVKRARSFKPSPELTAFVEKYGREGVPALLHLLRGAGGTAHTEGLQWALAQTATKAEAEHIIAASRTQWAFIPLARKLDEDATTEVLVEEWFAQKAKWDVNSQFADAVLAAGLKRMYPLALDHISSLGHNFHALVFDMDRVLNREQSADLDVAFRDTMALFIKRLYASQDTCDPRILQIALRRGTPEAIGALFKDRGWTNPDILKATRPLIALPAPDDEALAHLRNNAALWIWDAAAQKYILPLAGHSEAHTPQQSLDLHRASGAGSGQ